MSTPIALCDMVNDYESGVFKCETTIKTLNQESINGDEITYSLELQDGTICTFVRNGSDLISINLTSVPNDSTPITFVLQNIIAILNEQEDVQQLLDLATDLNIKATTVTNAVNSISAYYDDIETVSNSIVDVQRLSLELATSDSIETLSGDLLLGANSEIRKANANKDNIDSVAENENNINAVNDNEDNINIVALNNDDISTVAQNITDIQNAEENAQIAITKSEEALESAISSMLDKWIAEANKLTADSYATEPEDIIVKIYTSDGDGTFTATNTNPAEYSALHWRNKTEAIATGTGVVYEETEQSLTNKTINDISNTVHADAVHYKVKNVSDNIIPIHTPIISAGLTGEDVTEVLPKTSDSDIVIGITNYEIPKNGFGTAMSVGTIKNYDSTGLSVGNILYADNSGGMSNIVSVASTVYNQPIAYVSEINGANAHLIVNIHSAHDDSSVVSYNDTSVKLELDKLNKMSSSLPRPAQLKGTYSLSNTIKTLAFDAITYTGNGSTQDIVTGISSVDFTVSGNGSGYWLDRSVNQVKTDAGVVVASGDCVVNTSKVHIKNRDSTNSHLVTDGIRGVSKYISTDSTNAEALQNTNISSFNADGVTVGTNVKVNGLNDTYIAYQTLYTHIKWGVTSQGKFQIEAYNPITNEGMIYYIGSGVSGHQISHSQGVEVNYVVCKPLESVGYWNGTTSIDNSLNFYLNTTDSLYTNVNQFQEGSLATDSITLGISTHQNTADEEHIMYYKCKSETFTIGTYTGTGANGNFIATRDVYGVTRRPRRVIIKRVDSTGDWYLHDSERGDLGRIWLNLSNAESDTSAEYVEFKQKGFQVGDNSTVINSSGGQYLYLVEFDTDNTGTDGSYFDNPTDTTQLQLTDGLISVCNGYNSNGVDNEVFELSGTITPIGGWIND